MICYSPPCQTFSTVGNGMGIEDQRGTLFYNALTIIDAKKPKYALMENVKNLTSKAHREVFDDMLASIEKLGYKNYWKVINSKDHGSPQNRARVFVVSIRNDIEQTFKFPESYDNGLRIKDLIEYDVDEKYYTPINENLKIIENPKFKDNSGLSMLGYTRGGRFAGQYILDINGIISTLRSKGEPDKIMLPSGRFRRPTPLEFFRFQGFSDGDYMKLVNAGIGSTRLTEAMGNSITVSVVEDIFKELLCHDIKPK